MSGRLSSTIASQVETVRQGVGVWQRDDHTLIRVTGRDAGSWLHTQTTNDVQRLASGQGQASAHLDRKGRVLAHFTIHRWQDEYWLIVERCQAAALLEQFDARLFLEQVTLEESGADVDQLVLQGSQTLNFLARLLEPENSIASECLSRDLCGCRPLELLGHEVFALRMSLTGEDGYLLLAQAGEGAALLQALLARGADVGMEAIDAEAREILRIEAGRPRFGVDMDSSYRLPETGLEREAVSYDKGCYVGQEVIARLKTYGSVKQALMGLVFDRDADIEGVGGDILVDGRKIGAIKSTAFSPTLNRPIALVYLDRDHRTPDAALTFVASECGKTFTARIQVLPFYAPPTRDERAHTLYERALELFEADPDDTDDRAIEALKEAILLSPAFEDAYEALGVILHRHQRVDEAIRTMRMQALLNPDCVMAHTNLSVFYQAKGMIDEAETEKAQAAVLQIKKASHARKAEEVAAAERERIAAEARERIGMFEEVLEFDPDDPLATFGMGAAYVQLNEYENAISYLQRATQVQKDYSAAYLQLGKCLEFTGRTAEACDVYRQGIQAASRKGDLMPMREMERRLKALTSDAD